jgi:hypothetical protein
LFGEFDIYAIGNDGFNDCEREVLTNRGIGMNRFPNYDIEDGYPDGTFSWEGRVTTSHISALWRDSVQFPEMRRKLKMVLNTVLEPTVSKMYEEYSIPGRLTHPVRDSAIDSVTKAYWDAIDIGSS